MLKKIRFLFKEGDGFFKDSFSDFLLGFDVISVETYEDKNEIVFLAFEETDYKTVVKKAEEFLEFLGIKGYEVLVEDFEERDWVEEFKRFFKPFDMNRYYRIIPLWEERNREVYSSDKKNIIIEPGQAFGTGLHGTTSVCAEFLKEYGDKHRGFSMLDAGTGSGILSLIAVKEGASRVVAFDIDPNCSEVFMRNFEINDVSSENVEFFIGTVENLKKGEFFDLVVVNIIESIVRKILPDLIPFAKDKIVVSGILEENSQNFEDYLKGLNLKILEKRVKGEWIGYLLER